MARPICPSTSFVSADSDDQGKQSTPNDLRHSLGEHHKEMLTSDCHVTGRSHPVRCLLRPGTSLPVGPRRTRDCAEHRFSANRPSSVAAWYGPCTGQTVGDAGELTVLGWPTKRRNAGMLLPGALVDYPDQEKKDHQGTNTQFTNAALQLSSARTAVAERTKWPSALTIRSHTAMGHDLLRPSCRTEWSRSVGVTRA